MPHNTLINGASHSLNGAQTIINGTGYKINSGKTLINGTSRNIAFETPKKWLWNENPQLSFTKLLQFNISFISTVVHGYNILNNVTCRALWLNYASSGVNSSISYVYGNRNYQAYDFGNVMPNMKGWQDQNQRYITFTTEPTGELLKYLWANAIPIS